MSLPTSAPFLVALLRAVNVGGTGKLAMRDLAELCASAGFTDARTYIQSGNVVFRTRLAPEKARVALERVLATHMGAKVDVIIRDVAALRTVLATNPFQDAPPARVIVAFSSEPISKKLYAGLTGPAGEQVVATVHELFIHYPEGQGASKLKLPKAPGVMTARNINTVTKLVEMCSTGQVD